MQADEEQKYTSATEQAAFRVKILRQVWTVSGDMLSVDSVTMCYEIYLSLSHRFIYVAFCSCF